MVFSVLSNRCLRNKKAAHQALASDPPGARYPDWQLCLWRPPLDADELMLAYVIAGTVPTCAARQVIEK
jgi:hypothetical protein